MSIPVRQSVLDNICTTLRAMSFSGGYYHEPQHGCVVMEPVDLLSRPAGALPVFVVSCDDRRGEIQHHPGRQVRELMGIEILAMDDAGGFGADEKRLKAEQLHADIRKALMTDIRRGGFAVLTEVLAPQTPEMQLGNQTKVLVQVPARCLLMYRDA